MYNLKEHIASVGAYTEVVGENDYFNDFVAASDPQKGYVFAPEVEEQEEEDEGVEEFDDE